jgi:nicotinamide riboside kinase
MKDLTVINLLGGPGSGKSTLAAGIYYELKRQHCKVELVTEFVKDRIYEGHLGCVEDQIYIFGQQQRRISRLVGNVDIAVTDSPIILSCLYSKIQSKPFEALVHEVFSQYNNINFLLERQSIPYTTDGRLQDLDEAIELDKRLMVLLSSLGIGYYKLNAGDGSVKEVMKCLKMEFHK